MKNSEQTARKRNKSKDPNCGQVVLKSPKRHCSDLGKKVRPKKLKCLAKGMSSDLPDPKKKQSESKKEARASSPVVIDSSSDLELLRDTKKRNKVFKKKKNRKLFCIQVQNSNGLDEGQPGTTDLHASKKCNKTLLEVGRQDKGSAMKRKKKKKEKRRDKSACLELLHLGDREGTVKQISGELKPSCQEMSSGQKKNRTVEQKVVVEGVEKKHFDYYEGDPENVSKKDTASCKCKDAQSRDGPIQRQNNLARKSEKDSEAIKKKKKKKKKKKLNKISPASLSCLAKIQENHCDTMSECSLKCGSEKKARIGKAPKEVNKAAKKEAKRKTGNVNRCSEAGQDIVSKVGARGGKEKRKKAKKHKMERDDRDGFEGSQEQQVKKKRRKKEIENSQDGGMKVKKEKETKITADEIKLVAFKKGNCDEVKIDKVRRQALQEEIDRESGKTKIAKEGLDNPLGQWSTAAFETPEEKTKFHRLMGGFKKAFAPLQSSPANANKPNMALDWPREQELQYNLEAEFKKAVEFKHHRGIGLGFQSSAPSGVHIDKYASKSIKFEA
ncbi:LOW QUALITY PROTEIN: lysine-rich nucleolar protein 1 [Pituophis catenifer annectens]|uniref:LOW QUALITY PROTEIN: lysine-rich nucleolar protein 1 n=1 Tax=Pituophis catenifer annectens TaxID=94852 RepID=UPI0039914663